MTDRLDLSTSIEEETLRDYKAVQLVFQVWQVSYVFGLFVLCMS
jgi:hypothetical protein